MSFVDIAGIVKGASEGAGLGNKFLANIRESDAICQVIRVFTDPDVVHVEGKVDPKDDIEIINTELILADLQTVEKALPRLEKEARLQQGPRREPRGRQEGLRRPLGRHHDLRLRASTREPLRELFLLTAKPFLYVFNVDVDELGNDRRCSDRAARARRSRRGGLPRRQDRGRPRRARRRRGARAAAVDRPGRSRASPPSPASRSTPSGLQTYLTAGPKESRAWTIHKGATAPEAAGVIHTDFQKGFIKAEVISFDDLVATGSVAEARAKGKARMEGKDYVMADGDVVEFRFNV